MIGPPVWLRRVVRRFERRWIPHHDERGRHTALVVSRLPNQGVDDLSREGARKPAAPTETTSLAPRER
jgi:hypothetical protein